jgi:hypothetical protein
MTMEDDKFEQHLRTFHPAVAPPLHAHHHQRQWIVVASAVAALCGVFIFVFSTRFSRPPVHHAEAKLAPSTVLQLQVADRKGDLDGALDRSAEQILPTASHPNSALNALSKE